MADKTGSEWISKAASEIVTLAPPGTWPPVYEIEDIITRARDSDWLDSTDREDAQRKLKDSQYWRERWSLEAEAAKKQTHEYFRKCKELEAAVGDGRNAVNEVYKFNAELIALLRQTYEALTPLSRHPVGAPNSEMRKRQDAELAAYDAISKWLQ